MLHAPETTNPARWPGGGSQFLEHLALLAQEGPHSAHELALLRSVQPMHQAIARCRGLPLGRPRPG